jgi:hypothetical protein
MRARTRRCRGFLRWIVQRHAVHGVVTPDTAVAAGYARPHTLRVRLCGKLGSDGKAGHAEPFIQSFLRHCMRTRRTSQLRQSWRRKRHFGQLGSSAVNRGVGTNGDTLRVGLSIAPGRFFGGSTSANNLPPASLGNLNTSPTRRRVAGPIFGLGRHVQSTIRPAPASVITRIVPIRRMIASLPDADNQIDHRS